MDVELTPELERFVQDEVHRGRYASKADVVRDALQLLKQRADERDRTESRPEPMLGIMADEAKILDEVVEEAMSRRESRSLRTNDVVLTMGA